MTELRGSLRNLGLVAFVEFLSQQRRTGRLKITQAGLEGQIAFEGGRIVSVVGAGERGEPALEFIALALADGDFAYADQTTDETSGSDPNTRTDDLQIDLQVLVDRVRREATPVLTSVPRFANVVADVDDEELELSRKDIAVLVAVDGQHTTAELLHGQPTLHALQTLTHLTELGVMQLDPVEAPSTSAPTATNGSVQTESLGLPQVRAGPSRRLRWLREVVQVVALTAIFALVLRVFVQSVHVEGLSMLPALHEGELLLVDRTAYFHDEASLLADVVPFTAQGNMRYPLGGPRRGDVVVFYSPTQPGVELVKRITGLPGENLRIADGQVFVNEIPLDEPYVASADPVTERYPENGQSIHVPDDSYFVLGDNRGVSQDSRQGWLVRSGDLIGRAWLTYWPPSAWGPVRHVDQVFRRVAPAAAPEPTAAIVPTPIPTIASVIAPAAVSTPPQLAPRPPLPSGAVQSGWPSDPAATAWFDGSAYRLAAKQATHFVAVAAPVPDRLADLAVTAVFHKVGGPPGGGYGIIIRDQGPAPRDGINQRGRFYVAEAGDVGEVGMWRRDDDHWVDLVPWTASDAVYVGGTSNELALRALGARLTFTVNGRQVAAVDDATLPDGGVGAFVGGDLNEVVLDQFTVEPLSAGATP
jgi:signal peptidase I